MYISPASRQIWTDGSCLQSLRVGGWAAIIQGSRDERVLTGTELDTNSFRMELRPIIRALDALSDGRNVEIHTDCQSLRIIREKGVPLKSTRNADLWLALHRQINRLGRVQFYWVRAHQGIPLNERANTLARAARDFALEEAGLPRNPRASPSLAMLCPRVDAGLLHAP